MGAHLAALHYWCEKWHGSREEADHFATTAAARAPQGSLLAALPLFAVYEHLPEVNLVQSFYRSEVVTKAMEGALFAVHAARPDDPMLAPPSPSVVVDGLALLAIPDRHEFVRRAYEAILGRSPSPAEELRQVRRLRFLRFVYTRGRFLSRLAGSWEVQARQRQIRRVEKTAVTHQPQAQARSSHGTSSRRRP